METSDNPGLEWAPVHHHIQGPSYWDIWRYRIMTTAGLLIAGGALWDASCGGMHPARWQDPASATTPVAVLLSFPAAPTYPRVAPGPFQSGEGHVKGTDSIDPALLREALEHRLPGPPGELGPDGTVPAGEGGRVLPDLDLSLPKAPGGTGWARGTGRDATRGGKKAEPVHDLQLVVVHQEPAVSDLAFEDPELKVPVRVLLTIGAEGLPTEARATSGPEALYADVLQAAMKWRFEPLAPHGLTSPQFIRLTFHPQSRTGLGKTGTPAPLLTRLIPLRQEPLLVHRSPLDPELRSPLVVLIEVGHDGVPRSAKPLSGPESLRAEAVATAMKWRFKPFKPEGLVLTYRLTLHATSRLKQLGGI